MKGKEPVDEYKYLKKDKQDLKASLTRAFLGNSPFITEIITSIIPNQRIDRVADGMEKLEKKYDRLPEIIKSEESLIFFIEEAIRLLSRANYEQKRIWVINTIGKRIYNEIEESLTEKFIIILDEISKEQMILLYYLSLKHTNKGESIIKQKFEHEYENIVLPPGYRNNREVDWEYYENKYDFNITWLEKYALVNKITLYNFEKPEIYTNETNRDAYVGQIQKYFESMLNELTNEKRKYKFEITELGNIFLETTIENNGDYVK